MDLALFDFDGTISSRDSFLLFLRRFDTLGFVRTCTLNSTRILRFLLGRYPNQALKEHFLRGLLRGVEEDRLKARSEAFCRDALPAIIREGALDRVRWHRERGDTVCVVTATPRLILEPWCRLQGLPLIGTELELDDAGRLTGRLRGANCRGAEKVRRVRERFLVEDFGAVFAYGDSSGDREMLEMAAAERRFFKPFRASSRVADPRSGR